MTTLTSLEETIRKLESLLAELRRVRTGEGPTEEELANVPRLRDWHFSSLRVTCLEGIAIGHPKLGTNSITTSALFAVSSDLSLAKTLNRFYRLSDPKLGDRHGQ